MSLKHSKYVSGKKIPKYNLTVRVLFFSLVPTEMVWQRFYVKCDFSIYLYLLLIFYLHKRYTEVISQLHLYMKCDKKNSENTQ